MKSEISINLAHVLVGEGGNGPGRRFVVWVRGCSSDCEDCFNQSLKEFEPATPVKLAELKKKVSDNLPLRGVSLSGGEPFDQPGPLAGFLELLAEDPATRELDIICYTGRRHEELAGSGKATARLLGLVDLLADGPYVSSLRSSSPGRGSSNQRLVPLTKRGEILKREWEESCGEAFEVHLGERGEVIVTGFPPQDLLEKLSAKL